MIDEVSKAAATLRGLASGLRVSQALYVAAELRVADRLSERSLNSVELAAATGTDAAALGRIMQALCALGVFSESASGHFSLTSVGRLLRSDVPNSWRAGVLFMTGPVRWRCWSQLLETVKTGGNASERVLGRQLFEFYAADPEESKIHNDAMRSFSASHAAAIVAKIDFGHARLVIDVGGGTGEFLAAILAAHPELRGVLFDLPNVVDHAAHVLGARRVVDRCTIWRRNERITARKRKTFEPVTLGDIRGHDCRDLLVYCESNWCNHIAKLSADWLPDDTVLLSLEPRMVCTACGLIGADVRPDWSPHTNRRHFCWPTAGRPSSRARS
jgi:hypothetical protein